MTKKVEGRKAWKAATFAMLIVGTVFGLQNISMLPFVHADAIITVNSTADDQDDDGECTLREAITASNTDTASGATLGECIAGDGNDTITFNITGAADYTLTDRNSATKDGYTIQPQTSLPAITDTVTIDGYSQPGSLTNTAVAPNPLNGTLLIQLDGSLAGAASEGLHLDISASGSLIRGMIINRFTSRGIGSAGTATDVILTGNYVGTDPTGLLDWGNEDIGIQLGARLRIGGLNPEDRNIVSGNDSSGASPNTGDDNWIVQGNYIGVGADGLTAIPNAIAGGSGSLSLDNSSGHIIGGPDATAINVISGNNSMGIAPHNVQNITIQNNYIGVAYDGTTPLGNGSTGINLSGASTNSTFSDNIVSNNIMGGISIQETSVDNVISGNEIHDNDGAGISFSDASDNNVLTGNDIINNIGVGISISGSSSTVIGGSDASESNYISGNSVGISVNNWGASSSENTRIQGNVITNSVAGGIIVQFWPTNTLIGGTNINEGNIINNNGLGGVIVAQTTISALPITLTPNRIAILGNTIQDNIATMPNSGLGIDLGGFIDDSMPPDGNPEVINDFGPTPNDASDADTGANGYINFPVLSTATQNGSSLSVALDLDAADSPSNEYRVEFFANDTADSSGHGEGQTFLGATTLSPGSGQTATITLPSGTDLTGKVLSATTTAIDASTNSGFGSTSEFSAVVTPQVLSASTTTPTQNTATTQNQANLGQTGQKVRTTALLTVFVLSSPAAAIVARRKYVYRVRR